MRISDWSSDVCSSDLHIVREEIDRDDAVILAAVGMARFDRRRQRHLHVLDGVVLQARGVRVLATTGQGERRGCQQDSKSGNRCPGLMKWPHVCCRSEEHTSELQSLMRNSYAVFCLKKNKKSK